MPWSQVCDCRGRLGQEELAGGLYGALAADIEEVSVRGCLLWLPAVVFVRPKFNTMVSK